MAIQVKANRAANTFSISGLNRAQLELLFTGLFKLESATYKEPESGREAELYPEAKELYSEMHEATKLKQAQMNSQ